MGGAGPRETRQFFVDGCFDTSCRICLDHAVCVRMAIGVTEPSSDEDEIQQSGVDSSCFGEGEHCWDKLRELDLGLDVGRMCTTQM